MILSQRMTHARALWCVIKNITHARTKKGTITVGWLEAEFEKRNWKLELQAPQGPYTNVLDLQLFPAMSKRHSTLLQLYSDVETSKDKTWRVAKQVRDNCSSATVCRAFIHAFRIMLKIMEDEGNNAWLTTGAPLCNVRHDFVDTPDGKKSRVQLPVVAVADSLYW
jgi:hypothetical protein